jgi:small subunit ribosomal protein S9
MSSELIFDKNNIGIGRRKKATARIFLIPGTGTIVINKKAGDRYFQYNQIYLNAIWSPLKTLKLEKKFDIVAVVTGGGLTGQAEAVRLGVARRLCQIEKDNRLVLKPFGFLTRDARMKERKKYGLRKARKAPQYSKR